MEFKKYPKIKRLGDDENDGILFGNCHVQEKIDGANTSIWKCEDGSISCGSRNNDLIKNENGFNGFVDYVKAHEGIKDLLHDFPNHRLYGEWLVKHTVQYNETAYKQFYLFDIEADGKFLSTGIVNGLAKEYAISAPQYFGCFKDPTIEQLNEMVGKSTIGDKGEGIVIKNLSFVNKFGDSPYAKIVTQGFKEQNDIVFGGNNKHSDTYWEMYVVNKYITLARVKKIVQKIETLEGRKVKIEDTARIINTVYHDMITEEIWEIQKKVQLINLKRLGGLSMKKAARIFHDILNDPKESTI